MNSISRRRGKKEIEEKGQKKRDCKRVGHFVVQAVNGLNFQTSEATQVKHFDEHSILLGAT